MRKAAMLVVTLALWLPGAMAQKQPQSKTTVSVLGLSCSTTAGTGIFVATAWNFGASNTVSSSGGSGGGVGKANVQDLQVTKTFDACSPLLFGAVVTGKHYKTLTLTQQDRNEADIVVTLTEAFVTSYQIGGTDTAPDPAETISFSFDKICIGDPQSGNLFCYDKVKGTAN